MFTAEGTPSFLPHWFCSSVPRPEADSDENVCPASVYTGRATHACPWTRAPGASSPSTGACHTELLLHLWVWHYVLHTHTHTLGNP